MSDTRTPPRAALGPSEITTPRLRLRPLRRRDAALIGLHASDRRVAWMTATIPHPYPPGQAEAFVERAMSPAAREIVWAIDAGSDEENGLIGIVRLTRREGDEAEINYWVSPAFWGTGYASEAVEAVVRWARATGWHGLIAEVIQDNTASVKVLTRAGFEYQGEGEVHGLARKAMVPTFRYRHRLG
ncbi:MAG: GNAT family N-acetyltransferase [Amaricoccus sp.]|uniref:GNAT family N-acetyltransferase n=1 Tax=Amaricoccus sp. TaxID=1872485 RepID=UPI0039E4E1FB